MPRIPAPGEAAVSSIADAERELAVFRLVLDTVDEAVLITSPDLEPPGPLIEYANPALARITGYRIPELLAQIPRIFQGPRTDRRLLDVMKGELAASGQFVGETINYRKDGSENVVEWLVLPLRGDDGAILHWISVQRDVTEHRQLQWRQSELMEELNHRVNNTLATVQSIVSLSWRTARGPDRFRAGFEGRLQALSNVHAVLAREAWAGASLRGMLSSELAACSTDDAERWHLEGEDVSVPPRVALPLALGFHELADNAVAHGALSTPSGHIAVSWQRSPKSGTPWLHIRWVERGGPPAAPPDHAGFGSHFLDVGLPHQLQAHVTRRFDGDETTCSIDLPLPVAA